MKQFYVLVRVFFLVFVFGFFSCEKEEVTLESITKKTDITDSISSNPILLSKRVDLSNIENKQILVNKLKDAQSVLNNSETKAPKNLNNYRLVTDDILYMEYDSTHTYTFKLYSKSPKFYVENLVLHFNLKTNDYDAGLVQYKMSSSA